MKSIIDFIKHFITPQHSNHYRSRLLHLDFLTYYLFFAMFLTFTFKSLSPGMNNVLGFATDISIEKLLSYTNLQRKERNLSPLILSERLNNAAKKKAKDMFAKNYWSHFGPNNESPWDFFKSSGYSYQYAGENLAKNYLFSKYVVDAWMSSPTHRENILKNEYTEIGFAVENGVLNGEETTLVVQFFGTPTEVNQSISNTQPIALSVNKSLRSTFQSNIAFFFMGFLSLILLADFLFFKKMNVSRPVGNHIAHIIFILTIIIGSLIVIQRGVIL